MNLYRVPNFFHLIDTHYDRLSNLFEIERWEQSREDHRIIVHLALQAP